MQTDSSPVNEKLVLLIQEDIGSSFSLAEIKHSRKEIFLWEFPLGNGMHLLRLKKASTYLFLLIERDFSETRFYPERPGVWFWELWDSETWAWCSAGRILCLLWGWVGASCKSQWRTPRPCLQPQALALSSARKSQNFCMFIPDPGIVLGTAIHTGISCPSQPCG